jgi:hypothetical protein
LRIIGINNCSAKGFPLEIAGEHCFLSIKVEEEVTVGFVVGCIPSFVG